MIAFLLCSVFSILYNPDFVHLAFIAPVALLLLAEAIEWALGYLGNGRVARAAGCVLAAGALFALGQQLVENTARRRATFEVPHQTAFGRVDFNQAWEPMLVDRLRALLDQTPSRQLFCYPFASSPYLTTGGRNPTPYQHLAPSQSPAWQVEQAAAIVRAKRVPYIVAAPVFLNPRDPIGRLIGEGYEYVPIGDADTPDKIRGSGCSPAATSSKQPRSLPRRRAESRSEARRSDPTDPSDPTDRSDSDPAAPGLHSFAARS